MLDTQKGYKGREACLYGGTNYNNIMPKNGMIRLKLIHSCVMEFLSYNQRGTVNSMRKTR
jgi:hypothetical protein